MYIYKYICISSYNCKKKYVCLKHARTEPCNMSRYTLCTMHKDTKIMEHKKEIDTMTYIE